MFRYDHIFWIAILILSFVGCKLHEASDLQHSEGSIALSLPPYVWHQSTKAELQQLLTANNPKVLQQNSPLNKRLQEIADAIDREIRNEYPKQTQNIPKPLILVYQDQMMNGYNKNKLLYIRRQLRIPPPSSEEMDRVVDLDYPGFVEAVNLPSSPSVDYEVINDLSQIKGWSTKEFVEIWNSKRPAARQDCLLQETQGVLEFSSTKDCSDGVFGNFSYLKISVHTDVIFLSTELLKNSTEASLFSFLAHELGHYYQGHVSSLGHNPEYFFLQNPENELKKPSPTEQYPEIRQALLQAKDILVKVDPIPGARLSPNIFFAVDGLYKDLIQSICSDETICGKQFDELKTLYDEKVRTAIYDPLNQLGKAIDKKDYPTYIEFENKMLATLNQMKNQSIEPAKLKNFRKSIRLFGLKNFFGDMPETSRLESWLLDASRKVDHVLAEEKENFSKATNVGLGYYSDEELADEISAEISAKFGLKRQEATAIWWRLLEDDQKNGMLTWQDMTVESCRALQAKNWQADGRQNYPLVLLGRLSDIHHSFCYRIFNIEREWSAHSYDKKFSAVKRFPFNEKNWQTLILGSL